MLPIKEARFYEVGESITDSLRYLMFFCVEMGNIFMYIFCVVFEKMIIFLLTINGLWGKSKLFLLKSKLIDNLNNLQFSLNIFRN